jgi:hypothetical protein
VLSSQKYPGEKTMNISINHEQRLFVIRKVEGYTCLGFDQCFDETYQLAERLGYPLPREEQKGSLEQYLQLQELLKKASKANLGTWFHRNTPQRVRDILESARQDGRRLRLFYGDTETGRDWMQEYDTIGTISRSIGTLKVPLLIASSRSISGMYILDDCIVRIMDVASREDLYRHPKYLTPRLNLLHNGRIDHSWSVQRDGEEVARFKTREKAKRWIAFMLGERNIR